MKNAIEITNNSSNLALQEFCDMEQLYRLIDNWSRSTGMYAVVVDNEGNRTSDSFGMTEFCQMVNTSEKGCECCSQTWKSEKEGVYVCPLGFSDFSIPIRLPDGQILGRVLAGQALAEGQNADDIIRKAAELGLNKRAVRDVLSRANRKSEKEMQGSYELLREMLQFFVEKNYSIWKTNNELKSAPAKKDRVLSQITQIMYSYNLTIDINTGNYSLIKGTGLEDTVARMEATDNYDEIYQSFINAVDKEYLQKGIELLFLERYRVKQDKTGHLGTEEFLLHYTKKPEWHEINVFAGYDENGEPIINILGRYVTEAHDKADTKAQLEIANASNAAKSVHR